MAWLWNLLANKDKTLIKNPFFISSMVLIIVTSLSGIISLILIERRANFHSSGLNYVREFKNNSCKNQTALLFVATIWVNLIISHWHSLHRIYWTFIVNYFKSPGFISYPVTSEWRISFDQFQCKGPPGSASSLASHKWLSLLGPGLLWFLPKGCSKKAFGIQVGATRKQDGDS